MQRLIPECEARGYRQMIAVIGDSANAGSIGLHTKTGFEMIVRSQRWPEIRPLARHGHDAARARRRLEYRAERLRRPRTRMSERHPGQRFKRKKSSRISLRSSGHGLNPKSRKQPHAK